MSGVVSTSHELNFDAAFGLFHGEICTSFTKEQIEVRLAKEPCGTKYGWQLDEKYPYLILNINMRNGGYAPR